MQSAEDSNVTGQLAMLAWAIWKQRNEVIYQETQPDVQRELLRWLMSCRQNGKVVFMSKGTSLRWSEERKVGASQRRGC